MSTWQQWNNAYLRAALDVVLDALRVCAGVQGDDSAEQVSAPPVPDQVDEEGTSDDREAPVALEQLCVDFRLTEFERRLVLLCAGHAMDAEFPALCTQIHGDPDRHTPTFDLALRVFNSGQWMPFSAHSTARYWELIELDDPKFPNLSPLRINETLLHYLTGYTCHDPALDAILIPLPATRPLVPSHAACAQEIQNLLSDRPDEAQVPIIQLTGAEVDAKLGILPTPGPTLWSGRLVPRCSVASPRHACSAVLVSSARTPN